MGFLVAKTMKENLLKLIDTIVGPTLDKLGSRPIKETWPAPNVSQSQLIDRQTGEMVGQETLAVRDGLVSITSFSQPTTLRRRFKKSITDKLGVTNE